MNSIHYNPFDSCQIHHNPCWYNNISIVDEGMNFVVSQTMSCLHQLSCILNDELAQRVRANELTANS